MKQYIKENIGPLIAGYAAGLTVGVLLNFISDIIIKITLILDKAI